MADELVIDASVAIAWLFREPNWSAARTVLTRGAVLIAPDLIFVELASAAAKRVWRNEIQLADAQDGLEALGVLVDEVVAIASLAPAALTFAADLRCSAYDATYLALAESRGARLITCDFKLADRVEAAGWGRLLERLVA